MYSDLPIYDVIPKIKESLLSQNTLVLQAPPGAGKSTIVPLELLHEPWLQNKKILMLEPRRLAARAVALRMADLLNEFIAETVGYRVRFDHKVSPKTKIEVLTEGMLTRILQQDNALENVGLIIFDEFHERSIHADLALALTREIQSILREDLRILIMSATLDGANISNLLNNAPILSSQGRQYPVEIKYIPEDTQISLVNQVLKSIHKILKNEKGDVLVFLPGAGEIHRVQVLLQEDFPTLKICPLYGDLPYKEQEEAILPDKHGRRKVVLSTTIAETSLTIEGIKIVLDCGYARTQRFEPKTGLNKLETVRISMDAADQRSGRAGRLGPGISYRLWSETAQHKFALHRNPEILDADLTSLVLELANWGVKDIQKLAWLNPPPHGAIVQAKDLLESLEAIKDGQITLKGKEMLRLPTHPRLAHLLLEAKEMQLLGSAIAIAAVLEERDPLPKDSGADLSLRLEEFQKYRANAYFQGDKRAFERIERLGEHWCQIFKINSWDFLVSEHEYAQLIAIAYPERIAKRTDNYGKYKLANGRIATLSPHDPLAQKEWLAIASMDAGIKEGKIFMAASLDPNDLLHLSKENTRIVWDERTGTLVAQQERKIGDTILESKPINNISAELRIKILCQALKKSEFDILPFTEDLEQWLNRIGLLKKYRPEESWPDLSKSNLKETLEDWLAPFLVNIKHRDDLKKLDLKNILLTLLPWPMQQKLEVLAPEKIEVPSGSEIKIHYFSDLSNPVLKVRLQELFGLADTPTINNGQLKLLLHLLSPGFKPVQVTQDLHSFWTNTYPEVRKEFRMRYPRHSWPEDPWTAHAVRGAKRRGS